MKGLTNVQEFGIGDILRKPIIYRKIFYTAIIYVVFKQRIEGVSVFNLSTIEGCAQKVDSATLIGTFRVSALRR